MTNREQAQTGMFIAVEKELSDDSGHYDTNNAFKAEVLLFLAAWLANKTAGEKAHADNSGFSQEKLDKKIIVSDTASNLSGKANVKFINSGKPSLAEQLNTEPSDYSQKADAECARLAQVAHDFLAENIDLIKPDYVTPEALAAFQEEITNFIAIKGNSEIVHEVSAELTQIYKGSFAPVMMTIDHLKFLVRDFKTTDFDFYTRFMASTKIPTINVHHTYVEGHVVGKVSGKIIEGGVFTLTKGKKSGTTDYEGNFKIEEVRSGKDILTGVLDGDIIYTGHITIKRGTTNHFEIVVEGK